MKSTRREILRTALISSPVLLLPRRSHSAPQGRLALFHTNDTHSRIDPFEKGPYHGKGGVARRATLLAKLKKNAPQNLVLDAGDVFQGTPWFNKFKGELDIKMMKALGYDAITIGNHEFDTGMPQLKTSLSFSPQLQVLSANYDFRGTPLEDRVKPHYIFQRGSLKVGVFGLGIALDGLVSQKMCEGVQYGDPRKAAEASVSFLREAGCHVVVCLSHLGHTGYHGEVGDLDWPKDVMGVDYVVGGHTHTFLEKPDLVSHQKGSWQTPVMQVGHSGIWIGAAYLTISGRRAKLIKSGPAIC